jgi:hypothetical protein
MPWWQQQELPFEHGLVSQNVTSCNGQQHGPMLSSCLSMLSMSMLLPLQVPAAVAALPPELWSSKLRRIALGDWLARKLAAEANRASAAAAGQAQGWHGAKGGDVTVDMPGGQFRQVWMWLMLRRRFLRPSVSERRIKTYLSKCGDATCTVDLPGGSVGSC